MCLSVFMSVCRSDFFLLDLFIYLHRVQMESELASMTKRVRSLEEDYEGTETKLLQTSVKLDEATKAADESERYSCSYYKRL